MVHAVGQRHPATGRIRADALVLGKGEEEGGGSAEPVSGPALPAYGAAGAPNLRSRSTACCGCSIECEMKSRYPNVQRVWQSPICATLKLIYRRMRLGSSATESGEMLASESRPVLSKEPSID